MIGSVVRRQRVVRRDAEHEGQLAERPHLDAAGVAVLAGERRSPGRPGR